MRIPDKVNILGLDYTVSYEELDSEDGYILPRKQRIVLSDALSDARTEQTLFHEIIHGVLDQLGYNELYEDERLVQGLAVGLHQALSDATCV